MEKIFNHQKMFLLLIRDSLIFLLLALLKNLLNGIKCIFPGRKDYFISQTKPSIGLS
jgi:hypothetical protein